MYQLVKNIYTHVIVSHSLYAPPLVVLQKLCFTLFINVSLGT